MFDFVFVCKLVSCCGDTKIAKKKPPWTKTDHGGLNCLVKS